MSKTIGPKLVQTYIDDLLDVQQVGKTQLVKVRLSSPDPELSARMANVHAAAYIRHGLKLRTKASEEAQQFLEQKLVELRARVEQSETILNSYRRDTGLVSLDDKANIVIERLTDLNRRLTEAEAARIALEAQVYLIRNNATDALPAVIDNLLIQTLREQLTQLEGEYAHLATQFQLGYPRLAQLKAQVGETRRRLQQEIQRIRAGLEAAYLAAEAEESSLQAAMGEQKEAALRLKDAAVEYAILVREADTNRQLYDSILQRMKEIGVSAQLRASNIFILDEATAPVERSKPNRRLIALVGALIGLVGAIGLAFFFEYFDDSFRTPEEAERYFDLPTLTAIPDAVTLRTVAVQESVSAQNARANGNAVSRHAESRHELCAESRFVIGEAYRSLCTALLLSGHDGPPKTILFTSSQQGEGKTTTMINTALAYAHMGVKVLAIDADLRHPTCHTMLKKSEQQGLAELLAGQSDLAGAIQTTAGAGFSFLGSGAVPPNPTRLIGSRKMYELLVRLQNEYDYILIDAPPVIPVSDAVLLSSMVDGVVLVVNGHDTPRQVIKAARSRLQYARARILGIAFNRVDFRHTDYPNQYLPASASFARKEMDDA